MAVINDAAGPLGHTIGMAKFLGKPSLPAPLSKSSTTEAQDWAVLALVALSPEGVSLPSLFEGVKYLLPALGLPALIDEPALTAQMVHCQANKTVQVERAGYVRCLPELRDKLLLRAWAKGWSPALGKAIRAQQGGSDFTLTYPGVKSFRIALLTEAFDHFMELVDHYEVPKTSFLAAFEDIAAAVPRPLSLPWLQHLPAKVGHLVACALLNRAMLRWEPLTLLVDWLQSLPMRDPEYRMILVEALLYQGRFQAAEEEVRDLDPDRDVEMEAPWPLHLAALNSFLQDRREEALVNFELAWEALRATSKRNRTPLLPGSIGWFHVLALIEHGQADQAERLAKIYGGREHTDRNSCIWDGLLDMALLAQGRKTERYQQAPARLDEGPMQAFIHVHATYWMAPEAFRAGKLDTFLAKLSQMAEHIGAPWFQAQLKALEARWKGVAGDGPRALADFMEATPPWQRTLDSLARLGQDLPANKAPKALKPRRLAWVLRIRRGLSVPDTWELEAREQRQNKGGEWGPGKIIPIHKVRSASVAMDFLTAVDQRTIEATTDKLYPTREDIWRILYSLAGHDALFIEVQDSLKPLQVRQSEPELRVKDEQDMLRLELFPPCDGGAHVAVEDSPDRLTIYAFTPKHREVGDLLGSKGLKVPAKAQHKVAKAVASVASLLAVHSDMPLGTLGANLDGVIADTTPELDLRPWGEGLRAQMRMRPVAGGPAFPPGEGAGELILDVAGRRCRTQRDLKLEQSLAAAVVKACPILSGGGWDWEMDEPMDCLGLMLQLEPLTDQVRLAWPEGERFKTPQKATASRLHLGLKGEGQWFALEGQLELDEGRILDLQQLLDLLPQAKGDFVPLGDGLWINMERHFRERLEGLRALAMPHGDGLRLAPASALALEELTLEVGRFTAPKIWKERAAAIRPAAV